ncbi:hypothetical protein KIW84_022434 [Lathyrus oleraceus]|uniref:Integrase catalytic domain-containing protein n=1 Tax=Pisum sativum TaxID=3888 RepID=A0A9D4YEE5_PEA|nr:hypothetical protein KIW84_022434 [Pisum sativum]
MEYRDSKLLSFLCEKGTLSEFSCLYTSQQNGQVERKHRHILDSVYAMLISVSCLKRTWGEATLTTVHIINRPPSSFLGSETYARFYSELSTSYDVPSTFDNNVSIVVHALTTNELPPRVRNPPTYLRDYRWFSTMFHLHEP